MLVKGATDDINLCEAESIWENIKNAQNMYS